MNRRKLFYPLTLMAGLVLVLLWSWVPSRSRLPSLVLICMDSVRYDAFWLAERAGLSDAFSPWARRAVRFDRVQAVAPWTVPSVASVMTGLYPHRHGAGVLNHRVANLDRMLPSGLVETPSTLGEILLRHGYRTANLSAHPWTAHKRFGLNRGFLESRLIVEDRDLLKEGIAWVEDAAATDPESPFFLNLHPLRVHSAWLEPQLAIRERLQGMRPDFREVAQEEAPLGLAESPESEMFLRYLEYVRSIAELRAELAAFLRSLDEIALLPRTLVVAYSDHGEEFHDHLREARAEAVDPRGVKAIGHGHAMFQELLHVPLVAWVPGRQGRTISFPASLIDILPTVLSWLHVEEPRDQWKGLDLNLYAETEEARLELASRLLFSSGIAYGPPRIAVLAGNWKMIMDPLSQKRWIYDLETDPHERRPVLSPPQLIESRLTEWINGYRALDAQASGPMSELPAELLKTLQSLGYLTSKGKLTQD